MTIPAFSFSGRSYDFLSYVDCKNWIGGQWVDAQSGETIDVDNPRHGKTMGQVAWSDRPDVDAAVAAAKAALPGWRATPLKERVQVLFRMKDTERLEDALDQLKETLHPRDSHNRTRYHRLRGRSHARAGRLQAAVREFHHAIRLRPRNRTLYVDLAKVLARMGDDRGAEQARKRASAL